MAPRTIDDFLLMLSYGQLTVTLPGAGKAALAWTEEHVSQGFAWSPHEISYGIPDHDGDCRVIVTEEDGQPDVDGCLWAVRVPVDVPEGGGATMGTVGLEREVALPAGSSSIVFETRTRGPEDGEDVAYVLRLRISPRQEPPFAIVERGDELGTDTVLREDVDLIPVP